MRFLIEDDKLLYLLEKRRDFESGCKAGGAVATGISIVFAGLTSDFPDFSQRIGMYLRILLVVAGVVLIIFGIGTMAKNKKISYSHKDLHDEIKELDLTSHRFSIVVIKDTFHEYANHYLVRYVKDWDCRLFFSFRTQENGNEENIIHQLANALHLPDSSIQLTYKTEDYTTKYSVKDKVTKTYDHKFYVATISDYPEVLQQDSFVIDDEHYYWMTYRNMADDSRIREANMEIVDFVKDNVG